MGRLTKVSPGRMEITEQLDDDWAAVYSVVLQDGAPVIYEVRVYPRLIDEGGRVALTSDGHLVPTDTDQLPQGGLTTTAMRQVKPPRAIDAILQDAESRILLHFGGEGWAEVSARAEAAMSSGKLSRLERLALVAVMYEAFLADRVPNVNATIAKAFQDAGMPRTASQIRDDVYAARRAELLGGRPGYGKVAGHATDTARQIVEELQR